MELYATLKETGELEEYLTGHKTAYSNRAEKLAKKSAARGVIEELYKKDSLEWIYRVQEKF